MSQEPVRHGGHCFCGAIRFVAKAGPLWAAHCHCHSCRRNTGAPFTTFVGFPDHEVDFEGEATAVYESSPGVRRRFCGHCGTPISYEADAEPGEIHFYISVLDRPEDFRPQFHVHFREAIPWLKLDDGLDRYAGSSHDEEPASWDNNR